MVRIPESKRTWQAFAILLLVALLAGGAAAKDTAAPRGAGPGRNAGPNPERMMQRMTERLSLTEKQQEQIKKIFDQRSQLARETFEKSRAAGADPQTRRKEMQEFRKQTDTQVEAVLTEKQIPEYRKLRAEREQAMRNRMRELRAGQGMGQMQGKGHMQGGGQMQGAPAPAPGEEGDAATK